MTQKRHCWTDAQLIEALRFDARCLGHMPTAPARRRRPTSGGSARSPARRERPASVAEREAGLDHFEERIVAQSNGAQGAAQRGQEYQSSDIGLNTIKRRRNPHPTVKPLALMQWLCRLVAPRGGVVLDPFMGSGSTGRAAIAEGCSFVGVEQDPDTAAIARARIEDYAPLFVEVASD